MGNEVYANGMEVSCKAANGKAICAFPDVCFTPPLTPATPPGVPIPYPNTGMASDTADGSKTVQVSGQEVMLKDKSCFKQSTGDEAGSAPKKNVITSKIKGKVYFNAWSMDVKFEGENVVRHLDLTTHNHASQVGGTGPWTYADSMAVGTMDKNDPCRHENDKKGKKYLVYIAPILDKNKQPTGEMYVGRTSGPGGDNPLDIANRRKASHHRKDIGALQVVCVTDSYAAVRGAEEKHQKDFETTNQSRSIDTKTEKKTQINPISSKNKKKKEKYMECAKQKNGTACGICGS